MASEEWIELAILIGTIAAIIGVAFLIVWIVRLIARPFERRLPGLTGAVGKVGRPLLFVLIAAGLRITFSVGAVLFPKGFADVGSVLAYICLLALIATCAWLVSAVVLLLLDIALARQAASGLSDHERRRRRTQMLIIRRLIIAVAVILAVGAMLLTIPGVEAVGASLLASAGLASVVAGIAAQSTLGNFFAGIQLAFSDALKVGDTVVVEEEYGEIEEITLTYVVVQIWDDRRLVMPSTYFTSTPFTNWTRNQTRVTGTVLFDVDWTVDVEAVRAEFARILDATPLWDRRSSSLVVLDATAGRLQLRASVTAADADDLWGLRCLVREQLVTFVQEHRRDELAVTRVRIVGDETATPRPAESSAGD